MKKDNSKSVVLSSFIWKFLERGGSQGIHFVIQLIIARILAPELYGVIAISNVFINVLNVFIQNGLNVAIIRKKSVEEEDYTTTFILIVVIVFLSVLLIFGTSKAVSNYYSLPILSDLMRFSSLILIIGSYNAIQNVIVVRNLLFKQQFICSSISILISGLLGVFLALNGFGIWALAIQQILNQFLVTILLSFYIKWYPKFVFSKSILFEILHFSKYYITSVFIDTFFRDFYTLAIGKIYNPYLLGVFTRGQQFPLLIVNNTNSTITAVLLPIFSKVQDDLHTLKQYISQSNMIISFLVFPILLGLLVIAKPLVEVLLTNKWSDSIIYIQLTCIASLFLPIQAIYIQAINSIGRSDIYLKMEVTKKVISIVILAMTLPFGMISIAVGIVVSSFVSLFINSYFIKSLFSYSYKDQIFDIFPSLLNSIIMSILAGFFALYVKEAITLILVQIVFSFAFYIGIAKITNNKAFNLVYLKMKQFLS